MLDDVIHRDCVEGLRRERCLLERFVRPRGCRSPARPRQHSGRARCPRRPSRPGASPQGMLPGRTRRRVAGRPQLGRRRLRTDRSAYERFFGNSPCEKPARAGMQARSRTRSARSGTRCAHRRASVVRPAAPARKRFRVGVVGGVRPADRLPIRARIEEGGRAVQAAVERPAPAGAEPLSIGEPVVEDSPTSAAASRAARHRFQVGCRPAHEVSTWITLLPSAARTRPRTRFAPSARCRSRGPGARGRRQQLERLPLRPHVEVDAVVLLHQLLDAAGHLGLRNLVRPDGTHSSKWPSPRDLRALVEIPQEVLERRHGTIGCRRCGACRAPRGRGRLRVAGRGRRSTRSPRVLGVLEEVVRDDEVEAGVGNRREPLAVVEDVDLDQRLLLQLGVVGAELG